MKTFCSLLAVVLLSGCAAPRLATPSGWPETTIPAPRAKVKAAVLSELIAQRYQLISESESLLVLEGSMNAWADFWMTNTLTGERPRSRLRFTFLDAGEGTRVVVGITFTHAPGLNGRTAEQESLNATDYTRLQYLLDCIAADLEGRPRPPAPPPPPPARSPKGA